MPVITSNTLRETIATYTREYVDRQNLEVDVQPAAGNVDINPLEFFRIILRATNDPNFSNPTGADPAGVRLVNVRWHVRVVGQNPVAEIVAPGAPHDAREGPSEDLPLLTAGDTVSELYLFPRHGKSVLGPGETDEIELQGWAPGPNVGAFTLGFDITADVDADQLGLEDQISYSDTGSEEVRT